MHEGSQGSLPRAYSACRHLDRSGVVSQATIGSALGQGDAYLMMGQRCARVNEGCAVWGACGQDEGRAGVGVELESGLELGVRLGPQQRVRLGFWLGLGLRVRVTELKIRVPVGQCYD